MRLLLATASSLAVFLKLQSIGRRHMWSSPGFWPFLLPGRGVSSPGPACDPRQVQQSPLWDHEHWEGILGMWSFTWHSQRPSSPPDFLRESLKKSSRGEAYGEKNSSTPGVRCAVKVALVRRVKRTISIPVVLFWITYSCYNRHDFCNEKCRENAPSWSKGRADTWRGWPLLPDCLRPPLIGWNPGSLKG